MPTYEYKCESCKTEFEAARPMSDRDKKIKCEKCGGKKVKRKLALAYAKNGGSSMPAESGGGCGCSSCSGGNCGSCGH